MHVLLLCCFLAKLVVCSVEKRIKHVTSDTAYHLDVGKNTLTLYKTLPSGIYIAAQINIYEQRIDCAAFNDHLCYNFPKDAALMVSKTMPQLNELEMIMRHHPREHYFFILPSSNHDVKMNLTDIFEEEEEELIARLYSIKI